MKQLILSVLSFFVLSVQAQFDVHFQDSTLRLDYTFSGDNRKQHIFLDELLQSPGWYGRRGNLGQLLLQGNGQITVTDTLGRDTIYRHSFSTLFQEWQSTAEATKVSKSFENTFLIPFPKYPVDVTLTLSDTHRQETSRLTHRVNPQDILIRQVGMRSSAPWKYLRQRGDSRQCIDVTFVAEGYTEAEMPLFYQSCEETIEALENHEPFRSMRNRFNYIAVAAPSVESGVSIPNKKLWVNTALGSNYDTFYSERYLTTLRLKRLHDVLGGIPYEHIVILANTANYGGGGIYNSYLMASAHHPTMRPVFVHEFGHSFGGLADEYYYDDQYETLYPADTEPWEPNITTLVDFSSKWQDMLPAGQKIPTVADGQDIYNKVGVYEGGGYQSKGVYRPVQDCRMKTNGAPGFCPVCQRALGRIILYYTEE